MTTGTTLPAEVIRALLPVLKRATRHLDVDGDCWFSCSTLTCDEGRKSVVCDCGADEAGRVLALVREAVVSPNRCVGTCTESLDPEGRRLGYCQGCYQDMPAKTPFPTPERTEK